jgi:hypothetical protein
LLTQSASFKPTGHRQPLSLAPPFDRRRISAGMAFAFSASRRCHEGTSHKGRSSTASSIQPLQSMVEGSTRALIHAYDVHDGSSTFDGRRFGASRTSLKRCDMNGFDGSREPTECSRCTDAMRQGLAEAFQVTVTPSFSRRCQSRLTGQKQKEVESARRDEGGMVSGCTEGHGMRENSPAVSLISMDSSTLFG